MAKLTRPQLEEFYRSLWILGSQAMSYGFAFVFSLMVCVPMSIHQEHFKGHCLLFSTGEWQERDGQFKVDWASQSYCNFTIFVAVITFLLSLGFGVRVVNYVRKGTDATFFAAFCEVVSQAFVIFMQFIAALQVTCGFRVWCGEMTKRFEECHDAAGNDIDKQDGIISDDFFFHMQVAQVGMWGALGSIVSAFSVSVVKLLRMHHFENLKYSMAKERKSLIANDNNDLVADIPNTPIQQQQQQQPHIPSSSTSGSIPPPRPPPPDLDGDGSARRRKRPAPSPGDAASAAEAATTTVAMVHPPHDESSSYHTDNNSDEVEHISHDSEAAKAVLGEDDEEEGEEEVGDDMNKVRGRCSSPPAAPPPPPPLPARGNQIQIHTEQDVEDDIAVAAEPEDEDLDESDESEDDDDERDFFQRRGNLRS